MLVAPTELKHTAFRALTASGRGSNKPERMGVDFAFACRGRWSGVQRKEIRDFVASVNDGRLRQEVQQMAGAELEYKALIIEGAVRWSMDGALIGDNYGASWNREKHIKQLLSVQDAGVFVLSSSDTADTARVLTDFQGWVAKGDHTSLKGRGPMVSAWGTKGNRDYQLHVLTSLPGIGLELATRILDELGMIVGLRVTPEQLLAVHGVGRKKVDAIMRALETLDAAVA